MPEGSMHYGEYFHFSNDHSLPEVPRFFIVKVGKNRSSDSIEVNSGCVVGTVVVSLGYILLTLLCL